MRLTQPNETHHYVFFRVTARHFAAHSAQNSEVLPPAPSFWLSKSLHASKPDKLQATLAIGSIRPVGAVVVNPFIV